MLFRFTISRGVSRERMVGGAPSPNPRSEPVRRSKRFKENPEQNKKIKN